MPSSWQRARMWAVGAELRRRCDDGEYPAPGRDLRGTAVVAPSKDRNRAAGHTAADAPTAANNADASSCRAAVPGERRDGGWPFGSRECFAEIRRTAARNSGSTNGVGRGQIGGAHAERRAGELRAVELRRVFQRRRKAPFADVAANAFDDLSRHQHSPKTSSVLRRPASLTMSPRRTQPGPQLVEHRQSGIARGVDPANVQECAP